MRLIHKIIFFITLILLVSYLNPKRSYTQSNSKYIGNYYTYLYGDVYGYMKLLNNGVYNGWSILFNIYSNGSYSIEGNKLTVYVDELGYSWTETIKKDKQGNYYFY